MTEMLNSVTCCGGIWTTPCCPICGSDLKGEDLLDEIESFLILNGDTKPEYIEAFKQLREERLRG